jgi:hypothetical protein
MWGSNPRPSRFLKYCTLCISMTLCPIELIGPYGNFGVPFRTRKISGYAYIIKMPPTFKRRSRRKAAATTSTVTARKSTRPEEPACSSYSCDPVPAHRHQGTRRRNSGRPSKKIVSDTILDLPIDKFVVQEATAAGLRGVSPNQLAQRLVEQGRISPEAEGAAADFFKGAAALEQQRSPATPAAGVSPNQLAQQLVAEGRIPVHAEGAAVDFFKGAAALEQSRSPATPAANSGGSGSGSDSPSSVRKFSPTVEKGHAYQLLGSDSRFSPKHTELYRGFDYTDPDAQRFLEEGRIFHAVQAAGKAYERKLANIEQELRAAIVSPSANASAPTSPSDLNISPNALSMVQAMLNETEAKVDNLQAMFDAVRGLISSSAPNSPAGGAMPGSPVAPAASPNKAVPARSGSAPGSPAGRANPVTPAAITGSPAPGSSPKSSNSPAAM